MLQAFRKNRYSLGKKLLLGFLILVFALFFGSFAGMFSQVHPVADIDCHRFILGQVTLPGCHEILPDAVDREAIGLRRTIENSYGNRASLMLQSVNLRQMALDQLIEQELLKREADRLGLSVSDSDLAKAIASQPAFQVGGRFNVEQYEQAVRRYYDAEPAVFESQMRDQLLAATLMHMVSNAVELSTDEVRHEFNRFGEKLTLTYIKFPYANFTNGINPTDQQVARFYQDNRDAFREPDRAKIIFVRYDPAALAGNLAPTPEDIQQNYERNLKLFTHPEQVHARHILIEVPGDASAQQRAAAKSKAEDLLQKLRAGADFAKFAKEYSDDPANRERGGDLGFFARGEMVKPFEDAAFRLKPGQLDIVQSQFGYHIIRVDEVKPAHVDTLQEAQPRIVAELKKKVGADTARQDIDQDLAAALEGRPLGELAKKRGLVAVETPLFQLNEPIKGAEDYPQLGTTVFQMHMGDLRAITSGPVPYLAKLVDRQPAHIPPLDQIKPAVRQAIVRVTAEDKAHQAALATLKQIKSASDFDAVAATNHLVVTNPGEFSRSMRAVPGIGGFPEATEAAAAVAAVPGVVTQVLEKDGDSFIFKVVARTPPSEEEWKKEGAAFTAQMLEQRRNTAWENFVSDLKRRALITVHADLLGEPTGSAPVTTD